MTEERDGQVVTFYSYKGGTGRTMALANVAWILAANGYRVLAVDWDLESPGLYRFFGPFIDREALASTGGVIELIREYEWATTRNNRRDGRWYEDYARVHKYAFSLNWPHFPGGGTLDFLSAGQQNNDYAGTLAGMNWDDFYERQGGGLFFDALRADMKRHYDFTLIDSRTGFSDVADICTIQLPDTLVTCFTLSEQSIDGAAQVARLVEHRYGNRRIRTLPVQMRIDLAEKVKADTGRTVARQRFAGLPSSLDEAGRDAYWARVQVPYQPFYAYEELLATFGDKPGSSGSLLTAYEIITEQITGGAVGALPPMNEAVRARVTAQFVREPSPAESELVLRHSPLDRVWAEWVTHVLLAAGVRVTDPWRTVPSPSSPAREITIVSEHNAADEAALVSPEHAIDRAPLAVFVADVRGLLTLPAGRAALIAGQDAGAAARHILTLIGRDGAPIDAELAAGPRFPGRPNLVFEVPGRNTRFTGREDDLRNLREQLRNAPAVVLAGGGPVALQGMGGIGKSQLALEYAHRFQAAYDIVWWIDAEQVSNIEAALDDLGAQLAVPMVGSSRDNAEAVLHRLRQTDARWLIIMDNAEDVTAVSPYLPAGGHLIITSRSSLWAERATIMQVDVFKRTESIQHLAHRVPAIRVDEADKIAELLGDLPIAIAAAAAWLYETGYSVEEYLRQISRYGPRILVEPQTNQSVEATWDLSLNRLRETSAAAYRLLQLCSVLDPQISLDLVYSERFARALSVAGAAISDDYEYEQARLVQQINRLALLRVDRRGESTIGGGRGRNGLVIMHRLLQHAVRTRMTVGQLDDARRQVHGVLADARPKGEVDDPDTWPRFRLIWPHLIVSDAMRSSEEPVRRLLIDRLRYLWLRGDLEAARALGTEVSLVWQQMLPSSADAAAHEVLQRQILHLQFNLGNVLSFLGSFEESRALDEEVLAAQRELLGPRHQHTLMTAGGLARDLRGLGRYREALDLDRATYAAWKDEFGDDHPRTLAALNNLASSHRLMGDFRAARRYDEAVHKGRRRILSDNHPDTLASAANLGSDLRDAGEYEKSVSWLENVYAEFLQVLGGDQLHTLRAQVNLGVSLRSAGRARDAAEKLESAYERLTTLFGRGNPDTLRCRLSLAVNLLAIDLHERAARELQDVLDGYRAALGSDHPHTLVCTINRAMIYRRAGDLTRAADLATRAADRLDVVLGPEHPYSLSARMNQAVCIAEGHASADALQQAVDLLTPAAASAARVLGPQHPNAVRCRANLALARDALDPNPRREVAAALHDLIAAVGPDHPAVGALRRREYLHRIIDPHPF